MEERKIDRRIRRTKKLLLQGLTKLMSEKKISNITVKELTDLVDVNRSTFYLYYRDIYDMVEQIETEMFNDFTEAFNRFSKETATYENLISFFTYVFEFVQDNAEMCKILLGHDGDYSFVQKFKQAITESKPLLDDSLSKIKIHFLRPFIVGGCIGIIQQWLADDMTVSPKEMAMIVTELIPYGGK
ncbi:TetR-like C-terminal domain-containing protein [Clostridium thermarum]|uniref:TetR-like C-terminal domain-containing protein n=1 Tax=Clostridium thermarum TaxID=1716543 RepID=UPI001123518E|nr:TetR-like C-terminal domain-containing protein [Clostridium thermarum]